MMQSPSASSTDIAACEEAVGAALPGWLRDRLGIENGWRVDDQKGMTREEWRFLPVLDRSDRKRRSRTAEDIAWHTRRLRQASADAGTAVPSGAVVVALAWNETTRLILLPEPADPTVLAPRLWRQNGVATPMDTAVDPAMLGRQPEEGPDSGIRGLAELPVFRYHPDPVATGSIVENHSLACPCCGLRTGWVYEMKPYGLGDQPANLCPWCIADGRAAATFGSEFVSDIVGEVPADVIDELNLRTPGFSSWQGERWLTHCGDAAAFLGPAGWESLQRFPDAVTSILEDDWDEGMLPMITKTGDISGYLFECLHCGAHPAYADAS